MYYVYVLTNDADRRYIGYTNDLRRRVKEHENGKSRYTQGYSNWELCYYEAFTCKEDALKREKALKRSGQSRRWLKERIKNSIEFCKKS